METRVKKLVIVIVILLISLSAVFYFMSLRENKEEEPSTKSQYVDSASVKLKMYIPYYWWIKKGWGNDLASKEITKKTGVVFDIEMPYSFSEESAKINLMLATNEFPDIMLMERNSYYRNFLKSKALMPLDELIDKYGPDIKKYTTLEYLQRYREEDDKLYVLPNQYAKDQSVFQNSGKAFVIRKKLYEQLGAPKLDTIDDLYSYLLKVKNSGIKVGGKDIIPLSVEAPYELFAAAFGSNMIFISDGSYSVSEDGSVRQVLKDPKIKECFRFINKLFREKLLDQEQLIQSQDEVFRKIETGKTAVFGHTNAYFYMDTANVRVSKTIEGEEYVLIRTPTVPGVKDIKQTYNYMDAWNHIVITKSCRNVVKAMTFLNYLSSEEGQIVSRIGPEGKVWNISNGNFEITAEYKEKLKADKAKTFDEIGYDKWNWLGDKYYDYVFYELLSEEERSKKNEYRKIITDESWHSAGIDRVTLDMLSSEDIAFSKIKPVFKKYSDMITMAKDDETFEKLYNEAIYEMDKLGLKEVEKEINRQIALYKGK